MTCLAFDTSTYTTSCAALGEGGGVNVSRLRDVQPFRRAGNVLLLRDDKKAL